VLAAGAAAPALEAPGPLPFVGRRLGDYVQRLVTRLIRTAKTR
jgi:hypothetical protein